MDNLTPEQRSKNMKAIKCKDTKAECVLRKKLWSMGYRYRKNYKNLIGKPDIVFTKYKLAVFCDGEFWHGKDYEKSTGRIGTNKEYWTEKIKRNIVRDNEVNKHLEDEGWTVVRFWNKDIIKDTDLCVKRIQDIINKKEKTL